MAKDVVSRIIAVDESTDTFRKIARTASTSMQEIGKSSRTLGQQIFNVRNAIIGLGAGVVIRSFVKAGSEVQDLTVQFKTLLGGTTAAKERLEDLAKFAQTTPFQLGELANASRTLETLTQGALSAGEPLRMIGDTAAATGANFQDLAMHIGRAYDGLQNNRPVGESMMRLQELGIVSGELRGEMERLQKQGLGQEAWKLLEKRLGENAGAMEDMSKTLTGLSSTFRDQLNTAMRQILDAGIMDALTEGLGNIVAKFNELIDSGALRKWGERLMQLGSTIKTMLPFLTMAAFVAAVPSIVASISALTASMMAMNPVMLGITVAAGALALAITGVGAAYAQAKKRQDELEGGLEKSAIRKQFQQAVAAGDALVELYEELAHADTQLVENYDEKIKKQKEYEKTLSEFGFDPTGAIKSDLDQLYVFMEDLQKRAGAAVGGIAGGAAKVTNAAAEEAIKKLSEQMIKQRQKVVKEMAKLSEETVMIFVGEQQKEMVALEKKFSDYQKAFKGHKDALLVLEEWYQARRGEIEDAAEQERINKLIETNKNQQDALQSALDLNMSSREKERESLRRWYEDTTKMAGEDAEVKQAIQDAYTIARLDLEKKFTNEDEDLSKARARQAEVERRQKANAYKQATKTVLGSIMQMAEGQKEYIALYKTAAIAQTWIDGISSSIAVFRTFASIPYVGYALGAAASAAIMASTTVATGKIAQQKFRDSGVVQGSGSRPDTVSVAATPGEMFINRADQNRLFNMIKTGSGGSNSNITLGGDNIVINGSADQNAIDQIKQTRQDQLRELRKMLNELKFTGQLA